MFVVWIRLYYPATLEGKLPRQFLVDEKIIHSIPRLGIINVERLRKQLKMALETEVMQVAAHTPLYRPALASMGPKPERHLRVYKDGITPGS